LIEVGKTIEKNIFKIPKGLNSKEIKQSGVYPVISQSKEFIIGYSDNAGLLVKDNFPLIVFGDHSKTIKFIEEPFIIGADGVKILKPKSDYNEKFFYYFLHGVITDTKDYGRHYSLLRKGYIANVTDIVLQKSIIDFLDNLKANSISDNNIFFNQNIENEIFSLQISQLKQLDISSELTHQLDLIKQLRQAFLREAMQGKLVKSTNTKETGQQLLAKIKAEKAKLIAEKKIKAGKLQEAEVLEGLHFEIPEHWVWCNLDDICFNITDGTHQTPIYTTSGRMFLSAQNVKPFKFMPEKHKYVSEEDYQIYIRNRKPEKGDLLIGRVGAGIGETAVIDQDLDFCIYVSVALVQPFKEHINSDYLAQVFNSPYGVRYSKGNISSKGGSAGNFNLGRIRSFQIPLPPLHEQEQIVAKLKELMVFCDGLEQRIKESQGYNEMLLQQVLREALQGEKA
jgi:type I restriction enzyme S subunit